MWEVEVNYLDSFYLKTSPDVYLEAMKDAIQFMGDDIVDALKSEAPVRTGRLREGHYSINNGLSLIISNDVEYAKYVIYGTSRQPANDYPSRVMARMNVGEKCVSRFEDSLIMRGVL